MCDFFPDKVMVWRSKLPADCHCHQRNWAPIDWQWQIPQPLLQAVFASWPEVISVFKIIPALVITTTLPHPLLQQATASSCPFSEHHPPSLAGIMGTYSLAGRFLSRKLFKLWFYGIALYLVNSVTPAKCLIKCLSK